LHWLVCKATACVQWGGRSKFLGERKRCSAKGRALLYPWRGIRQLLPEMMPPRVVSSADDFVILSQGKAAEASGGTMAVMSLPGLRLNPDKTSIRDARCGKFDFLVYTFGHRLLRRDGSWHLAAGAFETGAGRSRPKVSRPLRPREEPCFPVRLPKIQRPRQTVHSHRPAAVCSCRIT
jgi:hypothetical protein